MTEKFYETFQSRNLGIYLGPTDAYLYAPGGRKSYIDIYDFWNVKELANYLHYLTNNKTAYETYFEWKTEDPAESKASSFAHLFDKSVFTGTHIHRKKSGVMAWEELVSFLNYHSSWGTHINRITLLERANNFLDHLREHTSDEEFVQRRRISQDTSWPCRLCREMARTV